MASTPIDDIPGKHIQIYLHPYLFQGNLGRFPIFYEIFSPEQGAFNRKMLFRVTQARLLDMCNGLNEKRLEHELLTCGIVVFFYTFNKIQGIMGLNVVDDKLHIELICTNNKIYKGIGTYLIDVANEIALKLNKPVLTLNALEQAVPFYLKMGFRDMARNTIPMDKLVEEKPLRGLDNVISLRRSSRLNSSAEAPVAVAEAPVLAAEAPEAPVLAAEEEPVAVAAEAPRASPSISVASESSASQKSSDSSVSKEPSSNEPSSIPSYYSSDEEYSSDASEAVFRASDNGEYTAILDMKMPQNRRFRNMEHEDILAEITAGINTTGVQINIDNWSSGDKLLILYFRGRLNTVNNILVQMRPRVFLRRFNNGGTKAKTRAAKGILSSAKTRRNKKRTQKKRKDKKH